MELRASKGRYGKVLVEEYDGEDLKRRSAWCFERDGDFDEAARLFGVSREEVVRLVQRQQSEGEARAQAREAGGEAGEAGEEGFEVLMRGLRQPAAAGRVFAAGGALDALRLALAEGAFAFPEPVLSWRGRGRLAALDVDLHDRPYASRPSESELYALLAEASPRPACCWSTHGRGLRLLYVPLSGFAADELAAAAAVWVRARMPTAGVELKSGTRHPGYPGPQGRRAGPVQWWEPGADVGALALWLGRREAGDDAVREWLEQRGLEVGRRYGHEECPVDPGRAGGRDPVSVRDHGVYCHACNGRGVSLGRRLPGWFPYGALAGCGVDSALRAAIDRLCHWEHARFLVAEVVGLEGDVARLAYGAALKMRHGPRDPRVGAVFAAGADFVRLDRRWATLAGETYSRDVRPILARLPACQYVGADGKVGVDQESVARLDQPVSLSALGYCALSPIWGLRVHGHRLTHRDPSRVPIVFQSKCLSPPAMEHARPRYLPPGAREITEEESWQILESLFPGLSRALVRLLICAKGAAEGEVGMPPLVFVSGPTSAAKSSTVVLAAAMCGDSNHSVVWTSNLERVRQSLLEAKEAGSFVTFNEILKEGARSGQSMLRTMDFLLNLTPDSLSHKLYVGPVALGGLPVCVWTDTEVPYELKQDAQLARRLIHAHLPRQVDWASTLRAAGLSQVSLLRAHDPRCALASDVILSCVIDSFFDRPRTFEEMAAELGFRTLAASPEAEEGRGALKALFEAVCAAPALQGADAKRWAGRGWKAAERGASGPLAEAWAAVADECFTGSRRCSEVDWAGLMGLPAPAQFECRAHGQHKVALRFARHVTRKTYYVNEELRHVGLGPEPGDGGDGGPGDPERGEPA